MMPELTAAGALGPLLRPREGTAGTAGSSDFDRLLPVAEGLEEPAAPDAAVLASSVVEEGEAAATGSSEAACGAADESHAEAALPVAGTLPETVPNSIVEPAGVETDGGKDASGKVSASLEMVVTELPNPDAGTDDRGRAGEAEGMAAPAVFRFADTRMNDGIFDAVSVEPRASAGIAKSDVMTPHVPGTSTRDGAGDGVVDLQMSGQSSPSMPNVGVEAITVAPLADGTSGPGKTTDQSLVETVAPPRSPQPPRIETQASGPREILQCAAVEDRRDSVSEEAAAEGTPDQEGPAPALRPVPQADGRPEPAPAVQHHAAFSRVQPPSESLQAGPIGGGLPQTVLPDAGVASPEADARPMEEPPRPRSALVQNVLDRVAAFPREPGETVIRLKPHGMGLIEVSVQPSRDGGVDIALRIQNPLVLEAMQSERQAVAQALGTQGGSGSLSMDLFQSGSGHRGAQGDGLAAAPRNTTEVPVAEDRLDDPASTPTHTATLRSDHVNIVT